MWRVTTIANRRLRNARNEPTVLVRYFSKDSGVFIGGIDGSNKCGLHGKKAGDSSFCVGDIPVKAQKAKGGCQPEYFDVFKTSPPVITSVHAAQRCYSSNSDIHPHQEIGMPSLSPTMTEGNIARWLKKEGDKVSPGDVLCEVETDKATVEMECMEEGYIAKIIHGDGAQNIKVGEIIAITVEEEDDIGKFKDYKASQPAAPAESSPSPETTVPKKSEPEPPKAPEPKVSRPEGTSHAGERLFASPLARKLAEDNSVPLSSIKGTGPDGRILKADVEDYLASAAKGSKVEEDTAAVQALNYADIPVSQIRKVTASRLLLSKQTIPHYYLTVDTRVDKLMELRSQLNSLQEASGGKRISVNDLVIKAAALALRKVPACNSSWMNDFIRQYNNVNINVAVQTDNGLFVPVIKDADKKGLATISEEVKQLAQKSKDNSLKPADYEGGTFTVSNLGGPFGIKQFCAIINPPQSGILAVGSAERRVIPGAGPDQYYFGSFMSVTLSCDHRVIDGAIGAEWLKAFKGYIENPASMLL
ncbi:dihydrolipoyllysine-residue acetyltransferase component 2 of pyruvate dehydrogenase complex, mitochondrial-like isoform X2 [Asparagus officinalis]|uniref:dihydrolipoyllysine-residue acetyltransferase component 2 of pyruvate dehydrogenase complex, mitochondrial-like isoform X2 n=1 Tax=Asparagus officinalis TaxID=4686 RepID=UPI00098DF5F8|nr:dihydrolipoyllysine-residue acetyltransferase component 2 of pyruvate dehydrogenase complex, mitochondrial-like isoform X2 [Asparagus officinalis]